jgi:hypothetical protein
MRSCTLFKAPKVTHNKFSILRTFFRVPFHGTYVFTYLELESISKISMYESAELPEVVRK